MLFHNAELRNILEFIARHFIQGQLEENIFNFVVSTADGIAILNLGIRQLLVTN